MAGLRTEEVVLRAGTAKGTFFAHFVDCDHFLAALLAECLTQGLAAEHAPSDRAELSGLLARLYLAFATDADTVALLAHFSGPAGAGLGLDLLICRVVELVAEGVAKLQAAGEMANPAEPGVLAEALMALVFHAAASAQCPVHGDPDIVRTRAEALLRQMTAALLGA